MCTQVQILQNSSAASQRTHKGKRADQKNQEAEYHFT